MSSVVWMRGVPHLALHIFRVRSGFDHPGCPGGSQAKPIHETEAELALRWLDEAGKNVVVAHCRCSSQYGTASSLTNRMSLTISSVQLNTSSTASTRLPPTLRLSEAVTAG